MERYAWMDEYLMAKPGAHKGYKVRWKSLWYELDTKIFAAIGKYRDGRPILTLKCEPLFADFACAQYEEIIPGYCVDKRFWISVYLDGEMPDDLMRQMIDESYRIVFHSLTKKLQKQILEEAARNEED